MKKIIFMSFLTFISLFYTVSADEISGSFNSLNAAYQEFIGSCSNVERMAIIKYADGNIDKISRGYIDIIALVLDVTENPDGSLSFATMSDVCANSADKLYNAIVDAIEVVNGSDISLSAVKLCSDIEVKTNILVSGSKLRSEDEMTILDDCDLINSEAKQLIDEFFGYFIMFCIGITVILSVIDIFKIILNGKVEHKKHLKTLVKRIIALVIILLIPLIVNVVVGLLNSYVNIDAINCLES